MCCWGLLISCSGTPVAAHSGFAMASGTARGGATLQHTA
jgi:hypothetical protein